MRFTIKIENRNTNFRIIKEGGKSFALIKSLNGEYRTLIEKDRDGNTYFKILNPYAKAKERIERELELIFAERSCDAVRAVREGYAHALVGSLNPTMIFNEELTPVVFLDKTVGDAYRKKTLEDFKNAKFGYSVKFGSKTSFSNYFLTKIGGICTISISQLNALAGSEESSEDLPVFFETLEAAEEFVSRFTNFAQTLAQKVISGEMTFDVAVRSAQSDSVITLRLLKESLIITDERKFKLEKDPWKTGPYYYSVIQFVS